jgi:hypothetical protein
LQFLVLPGSPFVGNYVERRGVLAQDVLAGVRPYVLPSVVFDALVVVGIASVTIMLLAAVPSAVHVARSPRTLVSRTTHPVDLALALCLVGFAAQFSIAPLVNYPSFERYALSALPIVAFLVLRLSGDAWQHRPLILPCVATLVLFAVGFAYTADSASFDAARWQVSERAVKLGYAPLQIDGGFEWTSWHRQEGPPFWPRIPRADVARTRATFDRPFCVRVAIGDAPATKEVLATVHSVAPTRRPTTVYAYRLHKTCPKAGSGDR